MIEQTVEIATKDGATTTFIVHPERDGPSPVVLFFMDAPAIREELRDMARRIAAALAPQPWRVWVTRTVPGPALTMTGGGAGRGRRPLAWGVAKR